MGDLSLYFNVVGGKQVNKVDPLNVMFPYKNKGLGKDNEGLGLDLSL